MPVCCATLCSGQPCRYLAKESGKCGIHACTPCPTTEEECVICMEAIKRKSRKELACSHAFHCQCLRRWFRSGKLNCPVCRAICLDQLFTVRSKTAPLSARMQLIEETLPPPRGMYWPTYVVSLMSRPGIGEDLTLTHDQLEMVKDLAYQSFTRDAFYASLNAMGF